MKKFCALLLAIAMFIPYAAGADEDLKFLVLIYLCGTDLESEGGAATGDILEMLEANLPADGSVAVLLQTGGTQQWQNEWVDSEAAQRFLIMDDLYAVDEDLGQLDMGSADTLHDFVRFALENCPAERYGLVLWDHGAGATGGVCYDENTGNALSTRDIHEALAEAGARFEFIGFDACLMSTLEIASAIQPFANYMIASEELEPGTGWAYDAWLEALAQDPSMHGADIGRAIVDSFVKDALAQDPNDYVTLAVTDLERLDALRRAVDELGEALGDQLTAGQFAPISRVRASMRSFGDFADAGSDMVDLAALSRAFSPIAPEPAQALSDALAQAVVYSRNSASVDSASGLSILLPYKTKSSAREYLPGYDALELLPEYSAFISEYVDLLLGGDYTFSPPAIEVQALDVSDEGTAAWLSAFVQGLQQAADAQVDMSEDDLAQVAQSFGDVAYTLQLSQDELNNLGYVEAALLQDAREEVGDAYGELAYFDYGLTQDVFVDWNSGTVYGLFNGNWPTLEGQMVPMYDQVVTEAYTRSVIPAMVNGVEQYLVVVFNGANPGGLVVGYSEGYDEHGNPARGYEKLKPGDKVMPVYELVYWDENDEMQTETYEGQSITVGNAPLAFGYDAVESGVYHYAFCLNDVFGNYQFTDLWELDYE